MCVSDEDEGSKQQHDAQTDKDEQPHHRRPAIMNTDNSEGDSDTSSELPSRIGNLPLGPIASISTQAHSRHHHEDSGNCKDWSISPEDNAAYSRCNADDSNTQYDNTGTKSQCHQQCNIKPPKNKSRMTVCNNEANYGLGNNKRRGEHFSNKDHKARQKKEKHHHHKGKSQCQLVAEAEFMRQGLWGIVSSQVVKPVSVDDKNPTLAEQEKVLSYKEKAEKVAGELYLLVSQEQKVHLTGITDNAAAMWMKLKSIDHQKRSGAHFNAYDTLFSIIKMPDKSLMSLVTRVDTATKKIKNLCPKDFSINEIDNELICITLIRALPEEYSSFASSLQLMDKFSKEKLQEAFVAEELRTHHQDSLNSTSASLAAALAAGSPSTTLVCSFCSLSGHTQVACRRYNKAKSLASKAAQEKCKKKSKGGKGSQNAAAAQDSADTTQEVAKFAGKASFHSNSPSTSSLLVTDTLWTADTGATSHMTPNQHWLHDYTPHRVPVR
ncbi:hypothetical protein NM688_g5450 [Phlebia brevispora]|uniref:Uncharacterized protein n=1 Tax=Phlebia brevispora TaxID=194682 RepID=A0ACC1SV37_9APHY|nr:hypothetical protein NM688_g5450 [Phlebia brevispora]